MRTLDDQRIEVIVESENLLNLLEDLKGNRITFIPKQHPDRGAFTVFGHYLKTIDYSVLSVMPFEKVTSYIVRSN